MAGTPYETLHVCGLCEQVRRARITAVCADCDGVKKGPILSPATDALGQILQIASKICAEDAQILLSRAQTISAARPKEEKHYMPDECFIIATPRGNGTLPKLSKGVGPPYDPVLVGCLRGDVLIFLDRNEAEQYAAGMDGTFTVFRCQLEVLEQLP